MKNVKEKSVERKGIVDNQFLWLFADVQTDYKISERIIEPKPDLRLMQKQVAEMSKKIDELHRVTFTPIEELVKQEDLNARMRADILYKFKTRTPNKFKK